MEQKARPVAVVVIAVLFGLGGLTPLVTTLVTLGRSAPPMQIVFNLIYAAVMLYVAAGVWQLKPSAWRIALLIAALNVLFAILSIATAPRTIPPWVSLVMSAVVILCLTRSHVRAAFGQPIAGAH